MNATIKNWYCRELYKFVTRTYPKLLYLCINFYDFNSLIVLFIYYMNATINNWYCRELYNFVTRTYPKLLYIIMCINFYDFNSLIVLFVFCRSKFHE